MSDLLKTTRASEIFSITGLPDFEVKMSKKKGQEGQSLYEVELSGLDLFDPESLDADVARRHPLARTPPASADRTDC